MHCETFDDRLQQLLDRHERPEEDAPLAEHAASCAACREVLEVQAGLFDTVRDWSVAGLDIDLVDRVLAKVQPAVKPPRKAAYWTALWAGLRPVHNQGRFLRRWAPCLAVASALAVAVVAWRVGQQTPDSAPSSPTSGAVVETLIPRPTVTSPDEFSDEAVVAVARRLGTRMANGLGYVKTGRLGEGIDLPAPVAAGWRPFRHTIAAAFDALRKTLPVKSQRPETESSSWNEVTTNASIVA